MEMLDTNKDNNNTSNDSNPAFPHSGSNFGKKRQEEQLVREYSKSVVRTFSIVLLLCFFRVS